MKNKNKVLLIIFIVSVLVIISSIIFFAINKSKNDKFQKSLDNSYSEYSGSKSVFIDKVSKSEVYFSIDKTTNKKFAGVWVFDENKNIYVKSEMSYGTEVGQITKEEGTLSNGYKYGFVITNNVRELLNKAEKLLLQESLANAYTEYAINVDVAEFLSKNDVYFSKSSTVPTTGNIWHFDSSVNKWVEISVPIGLRATSVTIQLNGYYAYQL